MELLIVEKNGWSKSVKINRGIIRVGSASSNDIQLQSPKIAPVHIQILHPNEAASSCAVVNLAHEITARVAGETRQLLPRAPINMRNGDEILFGDYSITFRLPLSADVMQSATLINATLSFADAVLHPDFAATGVLTVRNAGEKSACQFQVELEGLPEDCFEVDPIPLMYSGAQEEVRIRLFHRTLYPPAGLQMIVVKVSAPESYPGEEMIIRQGIYVTPVFKQSIELIDDLYIAAKLKEQAEASAAAVAEAARLAQPVPVAIIESAKTQGDVNPTPAAVPAIAPVEDFSPGPVASKQTAPVVSDLKVTRAPTAADKDATPIPESIPAAAPQKLERPAPKPTPPTPSKPAPDLSKLRVMRASANDDEDAALTPAPVAAPQELPERPAPKPAAPTPSRPAPDLSKLRVMRASADDDEDAALTPAPAAAPEPVSQKQPERPAPKPAAPPPSKPAPDLSGLKVVRTPADADNFWDDR